MKQIDEINIIARNESMIFTEDEKTILSCMDYLDNRNSQIYYPFVKKGDCTFILSTERFFSLIDFMTSEMQTTFHWNENEEKKILVCSPEQIETDKDYITIFPFQESENYCLNIKDEVQKGLYNIVFVCIPACPLSEKDINGRIHFFEDLAEENNIAFVLFFDDDTTYSDEYKIGFCQYFKTHLKNVCLFRDYCCGAHFFYMFEFGGIAPKRIFLEKNENCGNYRRDNLMIDILRMRNVFFSFKVNEKRKQDYIGKKSEYEYIENFNYYMYAFYKFKFGKNALEDWRSKSKKCCMHIVKKIKKGRKTIFLYKYNEDFDRYFNDTQQ